MNVEPCTMDVLRMILPRIDGERLGLAIDVGVGTFDFYCLLFRDMGFETVAVEPLPAKELKRLCRERHIALIKRCVAATNGRQRLYVGQWQGVENHNLSSLRPDWWGGGTKAVTVKCLTLGALLGSLKRTRITCLKLDVEGMESAIIAQLDAIESAHIPSVLVFEYGGGDTRESGQAGWNQDYVARTMQSIRSLAAFGYKEMIVIEANSKGCRRLACRTEMTDAGDVFECDALYGNIIALRSVDAISDQELARISRRHCGSMAFGATTYHRMVGVLKSMLMRTFPGVLGRALRRRR